MLNFQTRVIFVDFVASGGSRSARIDAGKKWILPRLGAYGAAG
jgi:hypothetical protein